MNCRNSHDVQCNVNCTYQDEAIFHCSVVSVQYFAFYKDTTADKKDKTQNLTTMSNFLKHS